MVRAVRWLASLPLHLCPALRAPIAYVRYTVVLPVFVLPVLPVPVITGNTDHTYSTCASVNNSEQQQQQKYALNMRLNNKNNVKLNNVKLNNAKGRC